jgi:hypothetical protein
MSVKELLLALAIVVALNQLAARAGACEITPGDWAEVEEEISDE